MERNGNIIEELSWQSRSRLLWQQDVKSMNTLSKQNQAKQGANSAFSDYFYVQHFFKSGSSRVTRKMPKASIYTREKYWHMTQTT